MALAANAPMLIKATMVDGKPEVGILPTGQVVGVVDELPTVAELLDRIVAEAEATPEAAATGERLMDLTWSAEEEAFRAEARAWLEAQPGRWHDEVGGAGVGRHRARASPSTSSGSGGSSPTAGRSCRGRPSTAGGAPRCGSG